MLVAAELHNPLQRIWYLLHCMSLHQHGHVHTKHQVPNSKEATHLEHMKVQHH